MPIILRQNETLIKMVRRHRMFIMPMFFAWPLLIVTVIVVRYGLNFNFFGYWLWVLPVVFLVVVLILARKYFIWRNNALIITNQRVIKNEQEGFFSKTVIELLFRDIREVSYSKQGMSASLYDYGDLRLRTSSESEIIFEQIADPDETVELINKLRQDGGLGTAESQD